MLRELYTAPTVSSLVAPSENVTGTRDPRVQPLSSAVRCEIASCCGPRVPIEPFVTSRSRTPPSLVGSAIVTVWVPVPTSARPLPSPVASFTTGSRPTSRASCGLIPPPPNRPVLTTRSPVNDCDTLLSIDALRDAAKIVNRVTTPTPTMSAAAVPEVRRGFRMAFSRASEPVTPRSHRNGAPMTRLSGRATTGPNTTTPTIVSTAPSPASASTEPPPLSTAPSTTATPMAVNASPVTARRADAVVLSTDTSRIAASGATREALIAGATPATSVTITPTRSEEHTSELQSHVNLVCRLLLEKKKKIKNCVHYRQQKTTIK